MRGHNPIESPPVTRAITGRRPPGDPVPSLRARRRRRYKFIPDAGRRQATRRQMSAVTDGQRSAWFRRQYFSLSRWQRRRRCPRPTMSWSGRASLSPDSITAGRWDSRTTLPLDKSPPGKSPIQNHPHDKSPHGHTLPSRFSVRYLLILNVNTQ